MTIGAGYQVSVGASKNESVGISSTEQVGYIKSTIVGKEYTITVGNNTLHMSSEGTIEITANNIQVLASEYVEIKGKKVCVNGGCEGEKKAKEEALLNTSKEEKQVTKLYWSYGEEMTPIADKSRHYVDMNLHVETQGYGAGESVPIEVELPDGSMIQENITVGEDGNGFKTNIFRNETIVLEEKV